MPVVTVGGGRGMTGCVELRCIDSGDDRGLKG